MDEKHKKVVIRRRIESICNLTPKIPYVFLAKLGSFLPSQRIFYIFPKYKYAKNLGK